MLVQFIFFLTTEMRKGLYSYSTKDSFSCKAIQGLLSPIFCSLPTMLLVKHAVFSQEVV